MSAISHAGNEGVDHKAVEHAGVLCLAGVAVG